MSRTSDIGSSLNNALSTGGVEGIRDALKGKYVCPFCGSVNDSEQGTCPRCTMENSAATRKATKTRIGPWYVLQTRNPAAPGMTWETLVNFVRKGRVKPRSIVRGPTTHQLWRFAAHVKGLSREFGICYSCGSTVETTVSVCPTCNRLQDPPPNPDALLEASREGQMSFTGTNSPATIDGTVLAGPSAGPATVVGTVEPAPPENVEFVIPALPGHNEPAPTTATPGSFAAGTPIGRGSAISTPSEPFQGLSGDTSWTQIGTIPRVPPVNPKPVPPQPTPQRPSRSGTGNPQMPMPNPGFNPQADEDLAAGRGGNKADPDPNGVLSNKMLAKAFGMMNAGGDDDEEFGVAANAAARPRPMSKRPGPIKAPEVDLSEYGISAADVSPAQAFKRPGGEPPRQSGMFLKVALILLFLGGAGVGVALAVSADFRKVVMGLYRELSGSQAEPAKPNKPKTQPTTRNSIETPDSSSLRDGVGRNDIVAGTNTGQPAVVESPVHTQTPEAPATPPIIPRTAWKDSPGYKWYQEGIQEKDAAKALVIFKRIKDKVPKEQWPNDLDSRIKALTEELNGGRS